MYRCTTKLKAALYTVTLSSFPHCRGLLRKIESEQRDQAEKSHMASPAMEVAAANTLRSVLHRAQQAAEKAGRRADQVKVVAVSKTKPVSVIRQVYDARHRCFGENYIQEIIEKAPQLLDDIEWHFIGNLQRNKVKPLLTVVPNIFMVESVDDEKVKRRITH